MCIRDRIKAIIISSVVPPLIVPLCHMCERYFELTPMVVGPGIKSGISLRYDNQMCIRDRFSPKLAHTKFKGDLL